MTQIKLYGAQKCNYINIRFGTIPYDDLIKYQSVYYVPQWVEGTEFLASFNGSLSAGNNTLGTDFVGWNLYRKNITKDSSLEFVALITNVNIINVRDYMVASNNEYRYYLIANSQQYMSSPFISDVIKCCLEDYFLLLAEETSDSNTLRVANVYRFGLNLNTSDINNNASTNKLINFTPYPKIQTANTNFMSGTLTSLTGYVDTETGKYKDSIEVIEDLRNLNINPKRKFLKDRKGFIREISIDAPISFGVIDETVEQIYSVTIPWCEIGSIDNVSLIGINDSYEWILTDNGIPKLGTSYLIQPNNHINPDTYLTGKKIF